MASAFRDMSERETDQLMNSRNTSDNQSIPSSQVYNLENVAPPSKVYSVLHWLWTLLFWVFMLVGGLHGLIMKGPVELVQRRQEWVTNGYLLWWGWLILALIIVFMDEKYDGFLTNILSVDLITKLFGYSSGTQSGHLFMHYICTN